jgi:hypothetical protein
LTASPRRKTLDFLKNNLKTKDLLSEIFQKNFGFFKKLLKR